MDIVNLRTQRLTEAVKDKKAINLNTKSTSLQSSSSAKKLRVLKQLVYFSSLIDGFNTKP